MQWLEDIKNKLAYCSDLSASSQKDLEGKLETIQVIILIITWKFPSHWSVTSSSSFLSQPPLLYLCSISHLFPYNLLIYSFILFLAWIVSTFVIISAHIHLHDMAQTTVILISVIFYLKSVLLTSTFFLKTLLHTLSLTISVMLHRILSLLPVIKLLFCLILGFAAL
jgi:hypothetical protein